MPISSASRGVLYSDTPATERRLTLAGVSTAVLETGSGPPVVALHGPAAHAGTWLSVLPALAAEHRVIAPDLPGQGASPVLPPLTAERVIEWLDALVDQTCDQPPIVIGHLTGGAIAARFAAREPARLNALVLVVPMGLEPFAPTGEFGAALSTYLAGPDRESHDALWRQCVRDLGSVRRRLGDRWEALQTYDLELAADPVIGAGLERLLNDFAMPAIPPDVLERIDATTRLVWGSKDSIVPLAVGRRAADRYQWPLHVLDGVGNEPALEAPAAFVEAVLS